MYLGGSTIKYFDFGDRKRSDKLMKTLDQINGRMGRDILKLSSSGINNKWKIGKERLSPCYTTRWSEILKLKYKREYSFPLRRVVIESFLVPLMM